MVNAYCCKCKAVKEMSEIVAGKTSRGVNMLRGKCLLCGGKMCKIGSLI